MSAQKGLFPPALAGPGLALASFALYSAHDVIVKMLGGSYSPVQIVFFSTLLGLPLALFLLLHDHEDANLRPRRPVWTLLRTAMAVVTAVTVFYAFSVLPMAQTYAILFATPLLITILSVPMLGEKVGWRRMLAVLVGLIGVLIVLRPGQGTGLSLGHLAALFGALTSALAAIILRKIGREERNIVLLLYPMMGNIVVMGLALPFVYRPMPMTDFAAWFAMAAMGMIATLMVIAAYKRAPAVQIAPMQYSQIIWAAFFGALFFGEAIDLATFLGAAVIIASGIYILFREDTVNVSDNKPVLQTPSRVETGTYPRVNRLPEADQKDPGLSRQAGGRDG